MMALPDNNKSDGFVEIYEKHITPIYRYVYSQIKHKQEAEDLTHDIFVKAFKAEKEGRAEVTLRYLFTIARRTIIDFWRKKKNVNLPNSEELFDNMVDERIDIEKEAEDKEREINVKKMIDHLKNDQKDVVTMRFISDLSTKEIAKIMNKTEVAIRKIQSRALNNMREMIDYNPSHHQNQTNYVN